MSSDDTKLGQYISSGTQIKEICGCANASDSNLSNFQRISPLSVRIQENADQK